MSPTTRNFLTTKHHYLKWKRLNALSKSLLQCSELWLLGQLWPGALTYLQRKSQLVAAAGRGAVTGLRALALSVSTNKRILSGAGFAGIVSPLSACMYLLFDQSEDVAGWYHVNNFYLFMLLGPYLASLFMTLGVFLLFPNFSGRAYFLLIPCAYLIGKIMWLYTTTSNAEYWSVPHWSFFAVGILTSTVLLIALDWLTWRFFHRELAFEKRLELIYNNANAFPAETVVSMFKTTMKDKKEFSKQY